MKLFGGVASQTDGTVNLAGVDGSGHVQVDLAASSAVQAVNIATRNDAPTLGTAAGNAAINLTTGAYYAVYTWVYEEAAAATPSVHPIVTSGGTGYALDGKTTVTASSFTRILHNGPAKFTAGATCSISVTTGAATDIYYVTYVVEV